MPLPNPGMSFTPFDPLPASDLTDLVENIEALADGSGLADGAVTGAKLSTSAIKIGYAERTTVFTTTTANAFVDVTSLSVEVTVPSGGRDVKITAYIPAIKQSGAAGNVISVAIREGTTVLQNSVFNSPVSNYNVPVGDVIARVSAPSAGSHTYKVSVAQSNTDTLTVEAGNGSSTTTWGAAFILVEMI